MKVTVPQEFKIVQGTSPVTTNGGVTADYVSLKNAKRCTIIVNLTQAVGHATALTIEQATTVAGAGSTAITVVVPIWLNADCAATDTLVKQASAVSQAIAATVKHHQVVFQLDPATLADTFDCITVKASDSSQATNFVSVDYLIETKYGKATPPTAITD